MAVTWKKLAYEIDAILESYMATKGDIIYASAPSTPALLAIAGHDNHILTVATNIPDWKAPAAPAAHTLNIHTAADGAPDFNLQIATDMVLFTVANEAALPTTGVALGQPVFCTAEGTVHLCDSAS
jgi:hypothetical protein